MLCKNLLNLSSPESPVAIPVKVTIKTCKTVIYAFSRDLTERYSDYQENNSDTHTLQSV